MTDFTHLSDEELMSRYNSLKQKQAEPESPVFKSRDYSTMSDEELRKAYEAARPTPPVVAASPVEAPTEQKKTGQDWRGDIAAGLRGVRAGIPFARDAATVIESLRKGVPFSEESKRQQERDRALQEEHPKSYFGGEVAGTFMPLGAPAKALTLGKMAAGPSLAKLAVEGEKGLGKLISPYVYKKLVTPLSSAGVGATWGAAQGFGEGDSLSDRLEKAKTGAQYGAGIGAAAPIVSKALGFHAPSNVEKQAAELQDIVRQVDPEYKIAVPSSIASEGYVPRALTEFTSGLPISKTFIERGVQRGKAQLEDALSKIPGLQPTAVSGKLGVGQDVKSSIQDWIDTILPKEVSAEYKTLDRMFAPHANKPVDLSNLAAAANQIDANLAKLGPSVGKSSATSLVQDAIKGKVPGGALNYKSAIDLKSLIGELRGDAKIHSTFNEKELSNLYRALSKDVSSHFNQYGGQSALSQYELATQNANELINMKKSFGDIIGKTYNKPGETIYKNLAALAGTGAKENEVLLNKAKSVIDPQAWSQVQSEVLQNLGVNAKTGEFDVQDFVKNYNKISSGGKDALFGNMSADSRKALENIKTISQKYVERGNSKSLTNRYAAIATALGAAGLLSGKFDITTEAGLYSIAPVAAIALSKPRLGMVISNLLKMPEGEFRASITSEINKHAMPKGSVSYAPVTADDREGRASGGRLGKGDYPAKRLSRMEKAVLRAQKAIAMETKPIMDQPDHVVAKALAIAMNK